MEDIVCVTIPRTSKNEALVSIRAKKYIRIYSSRRTTSRDITQKQFRNLEMNTSINPQKQSNDLSRISLKTSSLYNLQQTAKSLLYDIQKAESDKFEIIRDLSTYDYNFAQNYELFSVLHRLNDIARPLPEAVEVIEGITLNEKSCFKKVLEGLNEISNSRPNEFPFEFKEAETFSIRNLSSAQIMRNVYKGVCLISGIRCIVSLISDTWLEHLHFRAIGPKGDSYSLIMTQTMSNSYYTDKQLKLEVKEKLLPFLRLHIEKQKISMVFDSENSLNYYWLLADVRGYEFCNVVISGKSDNQILIEVPALEQSLVANIDFDFFDPFINLSYILKEVQGKLMYCKRSKTLLWKNKENIFENIEKDSKFFDTDYLLSTMSMGNYVELYTFEVNKFNGRIICFEYKDKVVLQVICEGEVVNIDVESKYYQLLQEMQVIFISRSPKTLSKSLELEYLFMKIFPRLALLII